MNWIVSPIEFLAFNKKDKKKKKKKKKDKKKECRWGWFKCDYYNPQP